ncbi:hypothetical protein ABZ565_27080 [Streptomyces sp. NPDC016469]|uniref:hypothetical protein n=1 Tax=Streptomyces sp. NPDC016469 TaxID=3157191 RepID=UPI0034111DB1
MRDRAVRTRKGNIETAASTFEERGYVGPRGAQTIGAEAGAAPGLAGRGVTAPSPP